MAQWHPVFMPVEIRPPPLLSPASGNARAFCDRKRKRCYLDPPQVTGSCLILVCFERTASGCQKTVFTKSAVQLKHTPN